MTKLSGEWASRFGQAAKDLRAQGPAEDVHPVLHQAQIDAAQSMADELASKGLTVLWEVWFEPTEKGREGFGWKDRLLYVYDNKEDADEAAYFEDHDEQAPDKHEYRRIVVKRKERADGQAE